MRNIIGALALAIILGGLGAYLDGSAKSSPKTTSDVPPYCVALGGPNAGYIIKDDGTLVCTDKRGRKLEPN